jgi:hypothetical protein
LERAWNRTIPPQDRQEPESNCGCLGRSGCRAPAQLPPSRKARLLIAYLALAPHPVSRERLCEILWQAPNDPRVVAEIGGQSPGYDVAQFLDTFRFDGDTASLYRSAARSIGLAS